ncbi:MAG: hypothetical protein AAF430_14995 [Myxococcota bacterium]
MGAEAAEAPRRRWIELAAWAVGVLVWVGIAAAALGPEYLPTHDGPQHLWSVHVAQHLESPQRGWSDWLVAGAPITSQGYAAVFAPLNRWLDWPDAHRATLAVLAVLFAAGAFGWARSLHRDRVWLGIALSGVAFGWTFYMGFLAFYAATGAAFALLGWAFARPRDSRLETAGLALGLTAVAWLHLVAAFLAGVLLAALLWFRAAPDAKGAAVLRIAGLALPGALLTGLLLSSGWDQLTDWNAGPADAASRFAPWWCAGRCFAAGPAWRAWPLTGLALVGLALAATRVRRAGATPEDRALWCGGALLFGCGVLLPLDLAAWDFFSPRFLPFGVAALLLTLPLERWPTRQPSIAVACSVFALSATAWSASFHERLEAEGAAVWAGVQQPLERRGPRLPIVFASGARSQQATDGPVPFALPWVNLGQLYATSQGGITPYGFALNPSLHHVLVRDDAAARLPAAVDRGYVGDLTRTPRGDDPAYRRALLTHLASQAVGFEDVVFAGRPEEADWLARLGFVEDWRMGGVAVARFRGCALEVELSPGASAHGVVGVGWFPSLHPVREIRPGPMHRTPDGGHRVVVREGCGPVWVRLHAPDAACAGADPEGRLLAPPGREPRRVRCRLADEPSEPRDPSEAATGPTTAAR